MEYKPITNVFNTSTALHTTQHNPLSEQINCMLLGPARAIPKECSLRRKYTPYAVERVVNVKNRRHLALGCTPFKEHTTKIPSLRHLCVSGCAAIIYDSAPLSKFHAKATPGIFLGVNDRGVYGVETLPDRQIDIYSTPCMSCLTILTFLRYCKKNPNLTVKTS